MEGTRSLKIDNQSNAPLELAIGFAVASGNDIGITYDNQYGTVLIKPGEEAALETKIRFPETAPPYIYWFSSLVMVEGLLCGLEKDLWAVPHTKEAGERW